MARENPTWGQERIAHELHLPVPLAVHRHRLPEHLRVVTQPILGSFHHAYQLAKVA